MSANITRNDLQRLTLPQLYALLADLQAQAVQAGPASQAQRDALHAIQLVQQTIAARRMPGPRM